MYKRKGQIQDFEGEKGGGGLMDPVMVRSQGGGECRIIPPAVQTEIIEVPGNIREKMKSTPTPPPPPPLDEWIHGTI